VLSAGGGDDGWLSVRDSGDTGKLVGSCHKLSELGQSRLVWQPSWVLSWRQGGSGSACLTWRTPLHWAALCADVSAPCGRRSPLRTL
jgi:hypothetical protein